LEIVNGEVKMGGINIYELQLEIMRECYELWHDLTGGELCWYVEAAPFVPDMFDRMEIANLSGVMFRG